MMPNRWLRTLKPWPKTSRTGSTTARTASRKTRTKARSSSSVSKTTCWVSAQYQSININTVSERRVSPEGKEEADRNHSFIQSFYRKPSLYLPAPVEMIDDGSCKTGLYWFWSNWNLVIDHVVYPTDEMVPPEDIEKTAQAVLDIQLPRSPDEIRSMINNINNLLSNATNFQEDLEKLEENTKTVQDLLQKAREAKLVTENTK